MPLISNAMELILYLMELQYNEFYKWVVVFFSNNNKKDIKKYFLPLRDCEFLDDITIS